MLGLPGEAELVLPPAVGAEGGLPGPPGTEEDGLPLLPAAGEEEGLVLAPVLGAGEEDVLGAGEEEVLPVLAAGEEEVVPVPPAAGGAVMAPVSVEGEPGAGLDELMAAPSEAAMYAAAAADALSTGGEAPASRMGFRERHHIKHDALPNPHVKPGWASAAFHVMSQHVAAASCHVTTCYPLSKCTASHITTLKL